MLLMASQRVCGECMDHEIVCVTMPLKVQDLISTVEMMCMNQARRRKKLRSRPKQRTEEEKKILWEAKAVLMERNHMTEEEAHRYIQKMQHGQRHFSYRDGTDGSDMIKL